MKEIVEILRQAKHILILGFGREGRSSLEFMKHHLPGAKITIADQNPAVSDDEIIKNNSGINVITGQGYLDNLEDYDIIIKSPGITLSKKNISQFSGLVTSQSDLFLRSYANQCIGVTGTKGKSTTSSLIYHIFKNSGREAVLTGNIGVPPFSSIEDISEDTSIVFELSAHQLEGISSSAATAVILNLFEEHLDHFSTSEKYYQSKMKIAYKQSAEGCIIYNTDNDLLENYLKKIKRKKLSFSESRSKNADCFTENNAVWLDNKELFDFDEGISLQGSHNKMNIMAALLACRQAGISIENIERGIRSFKGLPHRLEYAGRFKGIDFYNDSISTIPEACIAAVKTIKKIDTLILGGFDRGLNYRNLYNFLIQERIPNLIFIGPAGERMMSEMELKNTEGMNFIYAGGMENAFKHIPRITREEHCCLLSPAAASYDEFKDFSERGDLYKKLARSL